MKNLFLNEVTDEELADYLYNKVCKKNTEKKVNSQYDSIVKWLSSENGTKGIFIPGKLKRGTLKLLYKHEIYVVIRFIEEGFIVERNNIGL